MLGVPAHPRCDGRGAATGGGPEAGTATRTKGGALARMLLSLVASRGGLLRGWPCFWSGYACGAFLGENSGRLCPTRSCKRQNSEVQTIEREMGKGCQVGCAKAPTGKRPAQPGPGEGHQEKKTAPPTSRK